MRFHHHAGGFMSAFEKRIAEIRERLTKLSGTRFDKTNEPYRDSPMHICNMLYVKEPVEARGEWVGEFATMDDQQFFGEAPSDIALLLEMLELIENTPMMIQPEDLKVFVQKRDAIVARHEGGKNG